MDFNSQGNKLGNLRITGFLDFVPGNSLQKYLMMLNALVQVRQHLFVEQQCLVPVSFKIIGIKC
jgi:hypothetical protein